MENKHLSVCTWPDRKLPSLNLVGANCYLILATFRSVEAANIFLELCEEGIKADPYRPTKAAKEAARK